MVHKSTMTSTNGSEVVTLMQSARRAAWDAWWSHVSTKGDPATTERLWRNYELAVTTTEGEIAGRELLSEAWRRDAVGDCGPEADLGLAAAVDQARAA